MTESQIVTSILKYLHLKGIFAVRTNSGGFNLGMNAKTGKRYYVRNGQKGCPDILACFYGRFLAIEVKKPDKYYDVSEAQKEVIKQINDAGGLAIVACDIEDIEFIVNNENFDMGNDWVVANYRAYFNGKYNSKKNMF